MEEDTDISRLLNLIRDTIKAKNDGTLSLDHAKDQYVHLMGQCNDLEQKYISSSADAHIKGLMYHHNKKNNAAVTALFLVKDNSPEPLIFYGDKILLNALPELIMRKLELLDITGVSKISLNEGPCREYVLFAQQIVSKKYPLVLCSVSSSAQFDVHDFEFLAEILAMVMSKHEEVYSPLIVNHISDISSEISQLFNDQKGKKIFADLFLLLNPYEAFYLTGINKLIDYSTFIVNTLKKTYPEDVHIFALSLSNYIVLYSQTVNENLGIKQNKIDFDFMGNSIPYKVLHNEISSPQSLYIFLEKL